MLTISDADLTSWLGEFLWPFLRTLALFAAAPAFSSVAIPVRAKVAFAFILACLLATVIKQSAPVTLSWVSAILAVEQVLVGLAIGFAMQLALAAISFAGEFIGVQMGFGFAGLLDVQNRFEVPVMSDFFGLVGLLLFIGLNGHLLLVGVLVKSFDVVPIALSRAVTTEGWHALAGTGALLFQMGVWLALPVIAMLLVAQLTMALLSRVTPQLNIMSVGFSVFMWVGMAGTIALLPFFLPAVEHMIETGLKVASAALTGHLR